MSLLDRLLDAHEQDSGISLTADELDQLLDMLAEEVAREVVDEQSERMIDRLRAGTRRH